jgi:hypothetical protein
MTPNQPMNLDLILSRLEQGNLTADDIACLKFWLTSGDNSGQVQLGKYVVNIEQVLGQVHVGDRTPLTDEQIQAIAQAIQEKMARSPQLETPVKTVDELVMEVRSRIHNDIQRLHGTMPLWGVDHWVPLGELFVDVNILEEVSSSRRSELDDLWKDFNQNPGYRGLDRMGLGRERQRVSGLEVLARNTNLMVVGKPGSGKTTYLQRVVTECNAGSLQAHRIPVLIRLREFVDDGRDVAYSVERYLRQDWRLSEVEARLVLDGGRSLVLLDGLDEVTGVDGQAIAKQIKRFARDYPQVQVIVTCRTQSQESRFERFDSVEVADFNEPQVRAFAEHWFQTVCGDLTVGQAKATAFLEQLFREENKPIRELAITPILLSLTCAVFQQTGKFYSKRSKLYEEGLELLLEQWDRSREIERDEIYRDLSLERKRSLLSYLAVKKFEQEQYVLFEQAEIEGYIAEFLGIGLGESWGVLRAIEAQHGLLIERSQKVWSFSHLTFQEYLVAKWFCNETNWSNLTNYITDKYWREVFLLSVEISVKSHELLIIIKTKVDNMMANDAELQKHLNLVHIEYAEVRSPIHMPYYGNSDENDDQILCDLKIMRALCFEIELKYLYNVKFILEIVDEIEEEVGLLDLLRLGIEHEIPLIHYLPATFEPRLSSSSTDDLDSVYRYPFASELSFILEPFRKPFIYADIRKEKFGIPISWWNENQENWKNKIRDFVAIHHEELRINCLEKSQLELLERYYKASNLLLDCLNSACGIDSEARYEIEETLLLSIAEIEKRSRENAG